MLHRRGPEIQLDPAAKALLVIGLHADRRWVEERARAAGMKVVFVDPEALDNARHSHPHLAFRDTAVEAATDADLVVLATEWPQYTRGAQLPAVLAEVMRERTVVDIRNAVDAAPWLDGGWTLHQLGRPTRKR
ncbi:UDP binding domain-containing protein [Kitasatospora griseola]|uniref:UDP binding domain-containing protein n=1 Tax=Kitasatospora griseola TaxID=2064 RepID=UPI003804C59F